MTKEFCTYEQALALKELGFDKPCLGNFADDENHTLFTNGNRPGKTNAPTYSQAFRWFREKYDIHSYIEVFSDDTFDYITVSDDFEEKDYGDGPFKTYEEAESACLDKLIEICKNKQDNEKI